MGCRLEWRLLGREDRLLDKGEIDGDFRDRQAALQALSGFLCQFPVWGAPLGMAVGGRSGRLMLT